MKNRLLIFALICFSLLTPMPSSAQCTPPAGWEPYTVAEGDILFTIAGLFNTTVDALVEANCIADRNIIYDGQTLYVPPQQTEFAGFAGSYALWFEGAGGVVVVQMNLLHDGTVEITNRYENEGDIVQMGVWQQEGEVARVLLTRQMADGTVREYTQPERLSFAFQDGFLVATEYDQTVHGTEGMRFTAGSGDINPIVVDLQEHLAAIDFLNYTLPAQPGVFDEATRLALVDFQRSQGLLPNGVVDIITWSALNDPQPPVTPLVPPTPEIPPTPVQTAGGVPDIRQRPSQTADGRPILYLTFDDGPSTFTPQVLDVLARYNAKATFFEIGGQIEAFRDTVRRVVSEGHYVANHTLDHASLTDIGYDGFFREIETTHELLMAAAGDLFNLDGSVRYLRPPYGATDDFTRQYAAQLGYAVVLWTVDPQDWRRPGADQIAAHVLSHAGPGEIILMHDGGGDRTQTVAALETVLQQLSAQGYAFHTIYGS